MGVIHVHSRIHMRHPEINSQDVLAAWSSAIARARRDTPDRTLFVSVGFDSNGRLLEMVAVEKDGIFLVYHAAIPPTKKTLRELDLIGR